MSPVKHRGKQAVMQVDAALRQAQAVTLRRDGYTYREIAEQLNYSHPSGAQYAVGQALSQIRREPAAEYQALELDRLDCLQKAYQPQALAGDQGAAILVLRICESRRRLLGLDAPKRVNIEQMGMRLAAQYGLTSEEAQRVIINAQRSLSEDGEVWGVEEMERETETDGSELAGTKVFDPSTQPSRSSSQPSRPEDRGPTR